jgi:uncharacterized lipoprotein YddW (UPF0748 family)
MVSTGLAAVALICVGEVSIAAEKQAPVQREFRAAWISTVANIDWPSKPGLPAGQQKKELLAMFEKAVDLNLNAIILQVRPAADAIYPSKLEPWSPYLTGEMGKPPEPFYDPLRFAVEQAHKRGLQLHVWFNPYRVRPAGARKEASPDHSSIARKEIVRQYGDYLWFDPGEPKAVEHFINVLMDVVKRYDIDGVHIDDYFYPYPVKDQEGEDGKLVPFPDDESYQRAVQEGERLERDDWRRQNVNQLIERMYTEVKKAKPWVLVGISPFGIWRPENPKGIAGLDQYSALYADARLWQQQGWVDYFTPQLYWKVESEQQSYPKLLGWWAEQNVKHRHLWPGNFTSKIGRKPEPPSKEKIWTSDDILRQIDVTRAQPGAAGNVHFSMKALTRNYDGIADKLKSGQYKEPALVPESPWLGRETPGKPEVAARQTARGIAVEMKMPKAKQPWQWLVRVRTKNGWKTAIVPGQKGEHVISLSNGEKASVITVAGVSRLGRLGRPARAEIKNG